LTGLTEYHLQSQNDFSSNYPDVLDNGYPDGIGAEVFNFEALEGYGKQALTREIESIRTPIFTKHPEIYRIGTLQCPTEFRRPDIVLDVNTPEEYEIIARLYDYLYPAIPSLRFSTLSGGGTMYARETKCSHIDLLRLVAANGGKN